MFLLKACFNEQECGKQPLTRGFAHAYLALALHQWMKGRRRAARAAGGHRGSFCREARHANDWRRRRR